jgi:LysM repeat protein
LSRLLTASDKTPKKPQAPARTSYLSRRAWGFASLLIILVIAFGSGALLLNAISDRNQSVPAATPVIASQIVTATRESTPSPAPTLTSVPATRVIAPTALPTAAPTDTPRATATIEATIETPTSTPEASPTAALITYEVKRGDTCVAIARRFGVPVAALIKQNKLSANCFIRPGQVLTVTLQ